MKTLLWHTWEPGLEGNDNTSGGGGEWTKFLFKKFRENDIFPYWFVSNDEAPLAKDWKPIQEIDAAIFCWRWKLPNTLAYAERNMVQERQWNLLLWCVDHKIPFLIHDQDLKMSRDERDWVFRNGGLIATPSFFPEPNELSLHFPNPYDLSQYNPNFQEELIYVGNNYERLNQTVRYVADFSKEVVTLFYGNWIEPGPGRNPEAVRELLPNVIFCGRLPQNAIRTVLDEAKATIMLHKEEYGPRGFMTIRWAEAAATGTLPFIPEEFELPLKYKTLFRELIVSGGSDMVVKFRGVDADRHALLIKYVRKFVNAHMSPDPWISVVERMINGH